ncbi:hypothetical protein IFM89_009798 [Coptis chinensis]|uniref:Uncharacterized protein n=1 Tax=Coptis chinensis TaxID=261450 RepID=A0A835I1N0_9MAGN|nr:hypothetical protein IFM89_009798 [Coptis chinensis]
MEGSAEPVFINNNHNSPDSDHKTPCRRRKLVQSTLFPHKSQENNNCDDVDKEEEESGKRKRGRPKRTTPPTIKAHPINGQEAGRKERSDFFLKVSEKKLQQKQQNVEGAEPCLQINVMEELTEAEKTGIMEAKNGNLADSEKQTPRRRFDQSTLYPHGSQEKGEVKYNIKEEDEEYCGSHSGGKRKRKGKGKTKHTPPSKDSINGQVALNGSTQTITNENRLQHNEQKDQEGADSPNGNEKTCIELESGHCKRTYRKKGQRDASPRKVSTPSPRKVPTPSKLKGPHCRRIMTDFNTKDVDIQSEHATEQMIDLRLEEKIAAEENARLFAGRQTHPFFSSWKVGKKTLGTSEATELESKQCSILRDGQSVSYHTVHVFEMPQVSASDWRNGAQMKLKFGAAMESLGLNKWSLEVPLGLNVKHIPEFPSTQPCKSSIRESDDDVIEVLPETCKDKSDGLKSEPCNVGVKDNSTASHRGADKTLILFEDVDAVFDEDRGLIASIQQIAETAKRPIILTSSSKDPLLPDQLDRVEVRFAVPLPEELSSLVYMVCGAEQADINPELLDQFIRCCQGDIRKIIMLLQFWCQGKTNKIDRRIQSTYGPPPFDVDAGHHILPKVIPWEFPCQLAELVEREITKSLPMVKENASLLDIVEEEEFSSQDMQEALGMNMEAKKEAMLNRNFSIQDGDEFSAQCDGLNDFSNSSGSPVAFIRRTARRGICTVFSSHSEDEIFTDNIPKDINALSLDLCNGGFPGVSHRSPAHTLAIQDYEDPSTGQLIHSERNLSIQNLFDSSPTETTQNLCETYKSVGFFDKTEINDGADISCVPESSFVPETEINLGAEFSNTVSCGHGAVDLETVSTKTAKSLDSLSLMLASSLHKVVRESNNSENILRSTCDVGAVLVHKDEEVGDSQHEHAESVSRGYQVMDECSRADFNVASTSWENSRCMGQASSVPEMWRRLHSCRADLKSLLTSEQRSASQIVKLACGLTDLISVSDLMSGRCQPFMSDFLEPSMVPSAELDMFCWLDVQVQMTSTIAQHGLCFFAKETAAQRLNSGIRSRVDLASEMIASTTNPTVLGNLLTKNSSRNHTSSSSRGSEIRLTGCDISLQREIKERLYNTIQTVVPSKVYLALKGVAFHEYISSLGQISKLEASRLTENINKTKLRCRRKRAARHYLSSGPLMLSEEDVSFLARHSCFSKIPLEVSQV